MSVVLFRFSISNYKCCLDFGILAFTFVNEIVLYKSNMFIFPMMRLPIECKLIITNCHGEWWATEEKKHKIMRVHYSNLFLVNWLSFSFFLSFISFWFFVCNKKITQEFYRNVWLCLQWTQNWLSKLVKRIISHRICLCDF